MYPPVDTVDKWDFTGRTKCPFRWHGIIGPIQPRIAPNLGATTHPPTHLMYPCWLSNEGGPPAGRKSENGYECVPASTVMLFVHEPCALPASTICNITAIAMSRSPVYLRYNHVATPSKQSRTCCVGKISRVSECVRLFLPEPSVQFVCDVLTSFTLMPALRWYS